MSSAAGEEITSQMSNKDNISYPEFLTLGLIKTLEETHGIQGVELMRYLPCERMLLTSWEQRHSCMLPKDLKNFYLASDGFKLIWNYEYAGEILPIGNMKINCISDLKRIGGFKTQEDSECPTPLDVEMCHQQWQLKSQEVPNFGTKCKIFELDACQGLGKLCLVYQHNSNLLNKDLSPGDTALDEPKLWLLDRCFEWHFIADDFTTYFRMMIVHKGLPQWQFKFTPIGLTPWAEQMFAMLAPHLLQPEIDFTSQDQDEWDNSSDNLLDPAIFKLKSRSSKSDRGQNSRE